MKIEPPPRFRMVTRDYFTTLGLPILRGRNFDASDREGSGRVVIVNEALAEKFFPNEDPLGRLLLTFDERGERIIGVVAQRRRGGSDGWSRFPRDTCCTSRCRSCPAGFHSWSGQTPSDRFRECSPLRARPSASRRAAGDPGDDDDDDDCSTGRWVPRRRS